MIGEIRKTHELDYNAYFAVIHLYYLKKINKIENRQRQPNKLTHKQARVKAMFIFCANSYYYSYMI